MSKFNWVVISKFLFWLLIVCFPINLGLHFIYNFSFVDGFLLDYLIPTLYVQDILSMCFLFSWFMSSPDLTFVYKHKFFYLAVFFLFSSFLSLFYSLVPLVSITIFLRTVLYICVALYTVTLSDLQLVTVYKLIVLSMFFVSVLGIAQSINQGSVFNTYAVFGEQPYTANTFGISKEHLFGRSIVPAYGLFRHPNTFGAALVIAIVCALYLISNTQSQRYQKLYKVLFCVLSVCLFLTFSYISFFCLLISLIYFDRRALILPVSISILVLYSVLPLFGDNAVFSNHASLYRRFELNAAAFDIANHSLFYGIGSNISAKVITEFAPSIARFDFIQPIHNLFLLVLAENGIIVFTFLVLFFVNALFYSYNNKTASTLVFVVFLMSFFDHFFFTSQQTHLLFWVILGISSRQ